MRVGIGFHARQLHLPPIQRKRRKRSDSRRQDLVECKAQVSTPMEPACRLGVAYTARQECSLGQKELLVAGKQRLRQDALDLGVRIRIRRTDRGQEPHLRRTIDAREPYASQRTHGHRGTAKLDRRSKHGVEPRVSAIPLRMVRQFLNQEIFEPFLLVGTSDQIDNTLSLCVDLLLGLLPRRT